MNFSLATFIVDTAEDSPILYAIAVIVIMALVALAMHRAMEMLLKILKL